MADWSPEHTLNHLDYRVQKAEQDGRETLAIMLNIAEMRTFVSYVRELQKMDASARAVGAALVRAIDDGD